MRKLIQIVLVVALLGLCLGCEDKMTTSVWGDNDAIGTRIGYMVMENVEAGGSTVWLPDKETPEYWGAYAKYILPDLIEIPNPFATDETVTASPYFGGKVDFIDSDEIYSLIGGVHLPLSTFLEWQQDACDREMNGESKLIGGLYFRY